MGLDGTREGGIVWEVASSKRHELVVIHFQVSQAEIPFHDGKRRRGGWCLEMYTT
jgi:hypothetical protein